MDTHNPVTHLKKSLFLCLILLMGVTLACNMSPALVAPPAANTKLPPAEIAVPTTGGLIHPTPDQASVLPNPQKWTNNWLHFGVDNQFSSCNANETQITKGNVADLKLVWGAGCDDELFSLYGGTPALYHGQIIVTYAGGHLELGDPYTGDMLWHFGEQAVGWAPPPVISSDGIVYYTYVTSDASSKLYAVDAKTGKQIWEAASTIKTGFNDDSQPTIDEKNGLVYVLEDHFGDGRLYALDRNTGEIKWFLGDKSSSEGQMTFAGSIVPLKNDKLYVPAAVPEDHSKQERMVRIDALTQKVDLQYDLPKGMDPSSLVGWYGLCNNHLFESYRFNSYLNPATILAAHAIDQPEVTWQINVPGQSGRLACDAQKDLVYIPTDEGLLALEASTGKQIWFHKSIKSVFTPTVANGIVYYISDTNMYALDQTDGSQLYRYSLGSDGDPSTGVAVNDGLVVFSGSGGKCDLYVLGLKK